MSPGAASSSSGPLTRSFFGSVRCLQSVREQDVRALILVPTKELGQQVQAMIRQLAAFCSRDVRVADVTGKTDLSAQRSVPRVGGWSVCACACACVHMSSTHVNTLTLL